MAGASRFYLILLLGCAPARGPEGAGCTADAECEKPLACAATVCTRTAEARIVLSPAVAVAPVGGLVRFVAFGEAPNHASFARTTLWWSGGGAFDEHVRFVVSAEAAAVQAQVAVFPRMTAAAEVRPGTFGLRLGAGVAGGYGARDGVGRDARLLDRLLDIATFDDGRLLLLFDRGAAMFSPAEGRLEYRERPHAPSGTFFEGAVEASAGAADSLFLRDFPGVAFSSRETLAPSRIVRVNIGFGGGETLLAAADDAVFVLDVAGAEVLRVDLAGAVAPFRAGFDAPRAIAFDRAKKDAVYVLDGAASASLTRVALDGSSSTLPCMLAGGAPLPPTPGLLRVNDGTGWLWTDRRMYRLTLAAETCTADDVFALARDEADLPVDPLLSTFNVSGRTLFYGERGVLHAMNLDDFTVRAVAGERPFVGHKDGELTDALLDDVFSIAGTADGRALLIDGPFLRLFAEDGGLETLPYEAVTAVAAGTDGSFLFARADCSLDRFVVGGEPQRVLEPIAECAGVSHVVTADDAIYFVNGTSVQRIDGAGRTELFRLPQPPRGFVRAGQDLVVLGTAALRSFDRMSGEEREPSRFGRADEIDIEAIAPFDDTSFLALGYGHVHRVFTDAFSVVTLTPSPAEGTTIYGAGYAVNAPRAAAILGPHQLIFADRFEPALSILDLPEDF